jgi:hypothetical protein
MSYLPIATESTFPHPFAGNAVARAPAADPHEDPLQAWLSLMEVIEALCPEWPPRATTSGVEFRL